ncbi:M-phase phosphoprotein 9 [Chelonia mydas]|uniref:M-phase phosphoprotein 9 n=1 Tax=Chelonia mydas TaxID=8469 RepID=M7AHV2_CHEMY|nr:M-phase phosphoprotein 9 [Chelonia mydas]
MENLDLVKTVQELSHSSVESDIRSSYNSGCNLNTNSKYLTSWAQKLKQNQPKRTNLEEEGYMNAVQGNEQAKKLTFENTSVAAAASPSYTFYLSQPNESPNSLASEASGLTYWKLDEKEMYHSLPENFRNEFSSIFATKVSSDQVLTLDPTLHMKPGEQNPGHCFVSTFGEKTPFSPDSIVGPTLSSHFDTDSFSHTSNITSPQLGGSPKHTSSTKVLHLDPWENNAFQSETKIGCSFPMPYADTSNDLLINTDEESLTLTPSSIIQSQLSCADNNLPEYSISVTSFEEPVMLSTCDQLDAALTEASTRMRTLENKNNMLEMQVTDWRERFYAVSNTSKVLQERIEEMRASHKEKDNSISRLKSRLKDLEEAFEKAYKLSDNKDARLKEENKMFQDLLGEYESLGKEHERVKDTLNATENKLLDANTQISDLKRFNILLDDLETAPTSTLQHSNPRKQLQFLSIDDIEGRQHSAKGIDSCVKHSSCTESLHTGMKKGTAASGWEERNIQHKNEQSIPPPVVPYDADFKYTSRIKTLAETERLFDELTQEKQQEALEDRLERINRDLGSIRMTLKRFNVLRTSANL